MKINNYDTELKELLTCPLCGGNPVAYLQGNKYSKNRIFDRILTELMAKQSVLDALRKTIKRQEKEMAKMKRELETTISTEPVIIPNLV